MKKLGFSFLILASLSVPAATTITATNHCSYGANIGWLDWRGDTNNGAVIGEYVCSGYVYSANVGWINLGDGAPTNGIQYQNLSAADFGVNHDGLGNLRGYAYGANVGWVNFENTGGAKVDLLTGKLSGSVYTANCGWISLSNSVAFLQTGTIADGVDTDGDGIADARERQHFGNLTTANGTSDFDGDGVSDQNEYLADTNPKDANSKLLITTFDSAAGGTLTVVAWSSVLTRLYRIEKSMDLTTPSWMDSGSGLISPDGSNTRRTLADTNAPVRFYRVRVFKPLAP